MRYTEEQIIEMLNKGSVQLDNQDIIELIEYKNKLLDNARLTNEQLYEEMRERMDEETRIAMRMGYNKAVNEIVSECDKIKRTDYPVTNSVHMEDLKAITDVLKAKSKDIKFPKIIIADEIFRKFAGHSDYHGDTVLSIIACMGEGKEVQSARPLDTDELRLEAVKWFVEKLRETFVTDAGVNWATEEDVNKVLQYFEGIYG
jgi:hypothetical protein